LNTKIKFFIKHQNLITKLEEEEDEVILGGGGR